MKNIPLRKLFFYSVLIVVLVSLVSLAFNFFFSLDNSRKTERLEYKEMVLLLSLEDARYDISQMVSYFKKAALTLDQKDFSRADMYMSKAESNIKKAMSILPQNSPLVSRLQALEQKLKYAYKTSKEMAYGYKSGLSKDKLKILADKTDMDVDKIAKDTESVIRYQRNIVHTLSCTIRKHSKAILIISVISRPSPILCKHPFSYTHYT